MMLCLLLTLLLLLSPAVRGQGKLTFNSYGCDDLTWNSRWCYLFIPIHFLSLRPTHIHPQHSQKALLNYQGQKCRETLKTCSCLRFFVFTASFLCLPPFNFLCIFLLPLCTVHTEPQKQYSSCDVPLTRPMTSWPPDCCPVPVSVTDWRTGQALMDEQAAGGRGAWRGQGWRHERHCLLGNPCWKLCRWSWNKTWIWVLGEKEVRGSVSLISAKPGLLIFSVFILTRTVTWQHVDEGCVTTDF